MVASMDLSGINGRKEHGEEEEEEMVEEDEVKGGEKEAVEMNRHLASSKPENFFAF